MIPRSAPTWQSESSPNWQEQLQQAINEPLELLKTLNLDESLLPAAHIASQQFPLRVPHAFVKRMEVGNPKDPLLRQVLPIEDELITSTGYSSDPVQEQGNSPAGMINQKGLIQKYQGRILLLVNGHCAINCRYCFRRHFPYEENKLSREQWLIAISQIAEDNSIEEVIYSGGDPLASSDKQLQWLTEQIAAIPHVKRLRIHSRLPVVIPDRITDNCLDWLSNHRLQTIFVLHINHPNEVDSALIQSIQRLKSAGITLLNQAVLLRGVNDSVETLKSLSETLFSIGILPYYLHLLDPVQGAAHFDISLAEAEDIHKGLLDTLSGYLVPKLVKEVGGATSKTPIDSLRLQPV
ncbi:MAG: EF-P beta-lysylation protein EpmB [Cellvibrionaceae bacterium]